MGHNGETGIEGNERVHEVIDWCDEVGVTGGTTRILHEDKIRKREGTV